jgi:hypothetical protein
MALTRIGSLGSFVAAIAAGRPATYQFTVPAAGVPVDARLIILGFLRVRNPVSVTDAKGNVYVIRTGLVQGPFLADCQVSTALVSGDKITITTDAPEPVFGWACFWYSKCAYHAHATGTWASGSLAATGGAVPIAKAGELVLGGFGLLGYGTVHPAISTPGSGYTNEAGAGTNEPDGPSSIGFDWESKISAGPGSETATATLNRTVETYRDGITAAYWEPPPNPFMGVV